MSLTKKLVAKFSLMDNKKNPHTFLVRIAENQSIYYSLSGTLDQLPKRFDNEDTVKMFPTLSTEFENIEDMLLNVSAILNSSTYLVLEFKSYYH